MNNSTFQALITYHHLMGQTSVSGGGFIWGASRHLVPPNRFTKPPLNNATFVWPKVVLLNEIYCISKMDTFLTHIFCSSATNQVDSEFIARSSETEKRI